MAHGQQQGFLFSLKARFPERFTNCSVLDVGSMDINGTNRVLFTEPYQYVGLDLAPGKNVDLVCHGADYQKGQFFDVVITTEALEHDRRWRETLITCVDMVRPGGMLIITCAGPGRPEHGTTDHTPDDSPATNDYYHPLSSHDLVEEITRVFQTGPFPFASWGAEEHTLISEDTYLWAFKKTNSEAN